jgi:hypothetical protein
MIIEIALVIIALALLPAAISVAIPLIGLAASAAVVLAIIAAAVAAIAFGYTAIQQNPIETAYVLGACALIYALYATNHLWDKRVAQGIDAVDGVLLRLRNVVSAIIYLGASGLMLFPIMMGYVIVRESMTHGFKPDDIAPIAGTFLLTLGMGFVGWKAACELVRVIKYGYDGAAAPRTNETDGSNGR